MLRRSSRKAESQSSQPQKETSSKSRVNGETSRLARSQNDQHAVVSQVNVDEQVSNCVRYIVNNAGQNMHFRKADIQKHCAVKAGHQLQQVIEKMTEVLKNVSCARSPHEINCGFQVYGYNLLVCDQAANSGKAYIVSNSLPYMNYSVDKSEPDTREVRKILLLLILSHIFMSNFPITEAALYTFLKHFQIDPNVRHPLFGPVNDYIANVLVKQKYLQMDTDPISKKVTFSWGVRAEKEISKHEILKFVCKMQERQPKSWTNQYRVADEQGFENERQIEADGMDVDTD
jgi:hypothetical protein